MKVNELACPGPFDTLETPRLVDLNGRAYRHIGYRLEIESPRQTLVTKVGVISAPKDVWPGTSKNVHDAIAWLRRSGAEWLVVNGDLATKEFDLEEIMDRLGDSGLPVLMIPGNWESRGAFARVYKDRLDKYNNLINGMWVRQVVTDNVELWTVPGYYDERFAHTGSSCVYNAEDLRATGRALTPGENRPVVLISHGPPLGKGKRALDWIYDKANVGDAGLNELIEKHEIAFGIFGHILEAGGSAVGADFTTPVRPGKWASNLYVNAGTISADPILMNNGSTSTGMALLLTVKGKKAKYSVKQFKPAHEDE
jgi:Icc-related predicted phosphoesterase